MLIEKFIAGYRKYRTNVFPTQRHTFAALANGQQPPVLLITCADSRIVPNLVLQADPGDLFILRNPGNIVPPYGPRNGAEAAAIEYAVDVLNVRHVVICGHPKCGAIQALLDPDSVKALPAVSEWIKFCAAAKTAVNKESEAPSLDGLIQRNVLLQLEHLRTHPAVQRGLAAQTLHLHGWVYRFESGLLLAHDSRSNTFVELGVGASDTVEG